MEIKNLSNVLARPQNNLHESTSPDGEIFLEQSSREKGIHIPSGKNGVLDS